MHKKLENIFSLILYFEPELWQFKNLFIYFMHTIINVIVCKMKFLTNTFFYIQVE